MDDKDLYQAKYPTEELTRAEELEEECEECDAIREDMNAIYEADGLTYTHPER